MSSKARTSCQRIIDDVGNLIGHHPKIRNPGVGAPLGDTKPLLNACTVLTYTAWEVYVEDLLMEATPFLQAHSSFVSPKLRKRIAERVKDDPWRLASGRWKAEVERAVKSIAIGDVGSWGMNTANSKNVNNAFEEVFGARLLDVCSWQGMSSTKVKRYIDHLVGRRGAIVHRGVLDPNARRLTLHDIKDWAKWVNNLCERIDVLSGATLAATVGQPTW